MYLDVCLQKNIRNRQKEKQYLDDTSFQYVVKAFIDNNYGTLKKIYESAIREEIGWYVLRMFSSNSHDQLAIREIEKILKKNFL